MNTFPDGAVTNVIRHALNVLMTCYIHTVSDSLREISQADKNEFKCTPSPNLHIYLWIKSILALSKVSWRNDGEEIQLL